MREIKFRFWCEFGKEMLSWDLVTHEKYYSNTNLFNDVKFYLPLQYTGLKDINGIDIYEGDLLRFPSKDTWDETNFVAFEVFFHDGDMAMGQGIGFRMCRMHFQGNICGGTGYPFLPKHVNKMEVIGNIYENPELVK